MLRLVLALTAFAFIAATNDAGAQALEGRLKTIVSSKKIKIDNFDCAVFDGKYVTGDVDEAYLDKIEQARNDASKVKSQAVSAIIDLYNN